MYNAGLISSGKNVVTLPSAPSDKKETSKESECL